MGDHHRGGGAGDPRHAVMLGEPEAAVAPALGMLRKVEGVPERRGGIAAFGHRGEVEDGEGDHGGDLGGGQAER